MEMFDENHSNFKSPLNLTDLIGGGTTFSIDTGDLPDAEPQTDVELDFMNFPDVENHLNPIDQTFEEHKMHMEEVGVGVWKRILKPAPANAKAIDFLRHRVTYHRNFFMEGETAPFDSTYLNGKPDVICNDVDEKLTGFIEALSTMKESETALFIITYKKMFGASGCLPRVAERADILAELKVLKIDEIGDCKSVGKMNENLTEIKTFSEAKKLATEARLRAKDFFENGNVDGAIRIYQKINQMLRLAKVEGDAESNEKIELLVQANTNLATCYNIQDKPSKTIAAIREIENICIVDNQPKILFAKGKALRLLGEYKEALRVLKKAQNMRPNDKAISKELEKLDISIAEYNDISKKLSSNLFIN